MGTDKSPRLVDADGRPLDRIHGLETEYGLSYAGPGGQKRQKYVAERVGAYACRSADGNAFDDEQNRVYLDIGNHPEHCTAEEISFHGTAWRALRGHILMADRVSGALAAYESNPKTFFLANEDPRTKLWLVANTYNNKGYSWGSHENMLIKRNLDTSRYWPALMAHRASRIVWSGAGRVYNNGDQLGYELSEKAEFIIKDVSNDTTKNRGLINTRDETLGDNLKYRRDHGITGETVFSPFTNALRFASTDLILAACELGVNFDDLVPTDPVKAMRDISKDPSLRKRVEFDKGKQLTGLELQRELAERSISAVRQAGYTTPQREYWAERWLKLLDDLAADPRSRRLDWVAKLAIIENALAKPERDQSKSKYKKALEKSLEYHALLPREGIGMQLLKKGFFDDTELAPDLDSPIEMPRTRAAARAEICRGVQALGFKPMVSPEWSSVIAVNQEHDFLGRAFIVDPYSTNPGSGLDGFYERITGKAKKFARVPLAVEDDDSLYDDSLSA